MNPCQLTGSIWEIQKKLMLTAVLAVGCLLMAGSSQGPAAEQPAEDLVHQALLCGARGDWSQRESLLQEALRSSPDQDLARWHKGFLKYGQTWIHVDQLADLLPIRDVLNAYGQQREEAANDTEGNLDLANWCRQHKLAEQERAHLTRVLQLSPGHSEARRRLGHRQIGGRWVAAQDLWHSATASQQLQLAFKKWRPRLDQIQAGLEHRRLQQRTKARDELLSIHDVAAIPVIEAVFLAQPSRHASLALRAIGKMPRYEASIALARQAVILSQDSMRRQAVALLKQRPLDDYVPALLSGLASPVQSRVLIDFVDGRLYYRHVFHQEGWEQNNLAVADARYAHGTMILGGPNPVLATRIGRLIRLQSPEELAVRAASNAVETAQDRERQRQQNNAALKNLNERIVAVLAQTTGHDELASAEDWWSWWDNENGLDYPEKPTNTQYSFSNNVAPSTAIETPLTIMLSHACFAAGTTVWTALGPKAIDEMEVGDLVLSQDADSGEMALKPVLATTHGPEETPLLRINIGDDQLEATEGHPFWVNGQGWSLARKLTTKTSAFALDGSAQVHAIEEGSQGATYNLVVADFHSYFVGKSRILVHDITRRRPTNSAVPGVPREEFASASR